MKFYPRVIPVVFCLALAAGCGVPLPAVTPTVEPSDTPTLESTQVAEQATPTQVIRLSATPTNLPPTSSATTLPPTQADTPTITGTPLPSITPTLTSTATASPTDTPLPTRTDTPTVTRTPLPSVTPTLTPTPTDLPTDTPQPTATDTPIPTPTPLPLPNPTDTPPPTATSTATVTPSPTVTRTPLPSVTPSPTATTTSTATPRPTLTPTDDLTLQAQIRETIIARQQPSATLRVTATIDQTRVFEAQRTVVARLATDQPVTPPTLDVTPVRITATPGGPSLGLVDTPLPSSPIASTDVAAVPGPSATPTPFTPTPIAVDLYNPAYVTPLPTPILISRPAFTFVNVEAFRFTVPSGISFNYQGTELQGGVNLFAVNPASSDSYARTLTTGELRYQLPGTGVEQSPSFAPFFEGFGVAGAASNKNFISDLEWSPNGQYLSFIVSPPGGTDVANAGVWFWPAGESDAYTLLHDCVSNDDASCDLVSNRPAGNWRSIRMDWAPESSRLLVTLSLPGEGRQALTLLPAVRDVNYASSAPDFARYDSGSWLADGRILVSGRRPDGTVIIGTVDGNFGDEQVILDASAAGLWVQDAVQRPDGAIVALSRPGDPNGALRLTDSSGQPISDFIGDGPPSRVEWAADRNSVVLLVGGRQYLVDARTGAVQQVDTTDGVQVGTSAPPRDPGVPAFPQGVELGSRYAPGQQLVFIGGGTRNVRAEPSTSTGDVVGRIEPREFVAILAGPYVGEGYTWYRISTARNEIGWAALEEGGFQLLQP